MEPTPEPVPDTFTTASQQLRDCLRVRGLAAQAMATMRQRQWEAWLDLPAYQRRDAANANEAILLAKECADRLAERFNCRPWYGATVEFDAKTRSLELLVGEA